MSTELSTLVTEINDELRKVGAGFARVGELLHMAQDQLGDKWPEWVESNFAFSVSAANHHIQGWKSKVWVDDNAILLTALSRKNAEVSTPPELYVPEGGNLQDGGGDEEVETAEPIHGEIVADDPFDDGEDYEAEEDSDAEYEEVEVTMSCVLLAEKHYAAPKAFAAQLRRIRNGFIELESNPWAATFLPSITASMSQLISHLSGMQFGQVCDRCDGVGCGTCNDTGYIPKGECK